MTPMTSEPAYFPAQSTYAGAAQSPKVSHWLASVKRSKIVEAYWHLSQGECAGRDLGYRGARFQSPISARRRRKFFLRSESCGNFD